MTEHLIGRERANRRAEVMIANEFAERYGYDKVRGGQHGRGWDEDPSVSVLEAAGFHPVTPSDTLNSCCSNLLTPAPVRLPSAVDIPATYFVDLTRNRT